jgi:UDP-2,3-diacylglucosamine pyrophosphatase LpxH
MYVPTRERESVALDILFHVDRPEGLVSVAGQAFRFTRSNEKASPDDRSWIFRLGGDERGGRSFCGDIQSLNIQQFSQEEGQNLYRKNLESIRDYASDHSSIAKQGDKRVRILLLGDAGILQESIAPAVMEISRRPNATHLYLGDNIYPNGLVEPNHPQYEQSVRRLDRLLRLSRESRAVPIFVPGNHDWASGQMPGRVGYENVLREEKMVIEAFGARNYSPRHACPGPSVRKLGNRIYLVSVDSHWFLHPFEKPLDECAVRTPEEVFQKLRKVLRKLSPHNTVIFATHHPMRSFGPHSSSKTTACTQNMSCTPYAKLIVDLQEALHDNPPDICVAGHDHSVQLIRGDSACRWYVVSGALSSPTSVRPDKDLLFSLSEPSFATLQIDEDHHTLFQVYGKNMLMPGAEKLYERQIGKGK